VSSRFKFSDDRKAKLPRELAKGPTKKQVGQIAEAFEVARRAGRCYPDEPWRPMQVGSRYRDFTRSVTTTRSTGGSTVVLGGRGAKGRTR
jgi:hypothetical protein